MRRWKLFLVTAFASLAVTGPAAPAAGAPAGGGFELALRGSAPAPTVVLTNRNEQPCQVLPSALGTVTLSRVEQGGLVVEPVPVVASFDDDLRYQLSQRWRVLDPGASVELPLDIGPADSLGTVLRTVSVAPLVDIGALFAVDTAEPVTLEARYAAPIPVADGPPACPTATGSGMLGVGGTGGWTRWLVVAVLGLFVVAVLVLVFVLLRRQRRRTVAMAAVLVLVAAGLLAVVAAPTPARAEITGSPGIADELAACLDSIRGPGGDPRNILPTLEDPSVRVSVIPSDSGNGEARLNPTTIFVYWDHDNTGPLSDGVPRDPCDELYHELYHAFEDTRPEGVDLHECVTAAGPSGISIKEVNATRAENERRAALGHPQRTTYGPHRLPTGGCLPAAPDAPLCHPTRGCPPRPPGASHADPHVSTLDGWRYDFQAVGEFTLARDPAAGGADAFDVQTRQAPWNDSRYVAVNTAVAAKVAGDRVEIRLRDGTLELLVNGATALAEDGPLPAGGFIRHTEQRGHVITVDWPDESYLQVKQYAGSSLTVIVDVAAERAGRLVGLLADGDGDPANDLPGGREHDDLYPTYADGLRITDDASLFSYEDATSTDTFTDRTFPDHLPSPIPHQQWAAELCGRFGITDPVSMAECTVDLAFTGQAEFLAASLLTQSVVAPLRLDGADVTGSITEPGATLTVPFAGVAGERRFLDVVLTTIPDGCGVLTLRGPDGQRVGSGCLAGGRGGIDAVTLPATGRYTVLVDPPGNATGDIVLRLVIATDEGAALTIDGPAVTATVRQAGAVSRLTFPGRADQTVFVELSGATLPDACGVVSLRHAEGTLNSGCLRAGNGIIDRTVLPADGEYALVVDPGGDATGRITVRVSATSDQADTLTPGDGEVSVSLTRPGSVAELSFTATAGQTFYVAVAGSTIPGQCGILGLRGPDGPIGSGCTNGDGTGEIDRRTVDAAGTYTVVVDPGGDGTGQLWVRLIEAIDQVGTIVPGGPAVEALVQQPGAIASFSFTAAAGQRVRVAANASTVDGCGVLRLVGPDGSTRSSGCVGGGSGDIAAVSLPAAGRYTLVLDPIGADTGTASLRLLAG